MNTSSLVKRWQIFTFERFPPLSSAFLIFCFFGANVFITGQMMALKQPGFAIYLSFIVVFSAFFRLRLFDEIKDYKTDQEVNPSRPLARGVIGLKEAKLVAFSLLALELFLSAVIGFESLFAAIFYGIYSVLMYKEFFLSVWLRTKLTTYAVTHTVVSGLIAIFIFSATSHTYPWAIPNAFLLFAVANWMIFNVFEFGRKTFAQEEEREGVDSYSKNFGPLGAVMLTLSMVFIAEIVVWKLKLYFSYPFMGLLVLYLVFSAVAYAYFNSIRWAKEFRRACSIFILFYNLVIFCGVFLC